MWHPQVYHFRQSGLRVVVPELRGYGLSTVVSGITLMETFARDIVGLLDHLGLERVVLGGFPWADRLRRSASCCFPGRMGDDIPEATLAVFDEAAHMPNLERPTEFNTVLGRFLESLPARASGR